MKGITGRWIKNTLGVTLFVVLLAVLIGSLAVRGLYHKEVQDTLTAEASSIRTYISTVDEYYGDFYLVARRVLEDYNLYDRAELEVLDASGQMIISSEGFVDSEAAPGLDYEAALFAEDGIGVWQGTLAPTGEKVMSVTAVVYDGTGKVTGGVRLMSSLSKVNMAMVGSILLLCMVGLVIMIFAVVSGTYFVNTIVTPVKDIVKTAGEIAAGDYNVRIERKYDDEIGELSDTINDLAEGLTEADRVKNDFISTVSHELRTPLTAIKGWGETLLSAGDDRELTEKGLSVIVTETGRLSKMVEELLDFSRLQSGRLSMKMGPCDVMAELQEAVLTYEPKAKDEYKTLVFDEPAQDVPILTADGDRLRQVFVNIIDNAVKYTDAGGEIRVSIAVGEGYITVTVADNGCGIADADLPRIGEKFYKANFTRRGSGIGIATCNEIVRLHNGMLGIESKEGEGTKVSVALPVSQPETK